MSDEREKSRAFVSDKAASDVAASKRQSDTRAHVRSVRVAGLGSYTLRTPSQMEA
jgi:hypothetical protein